ncbi:MAG: MOSC N-terminal beta barrel domain-containing protein [Ignavibacterium sp.]
MKSLGGVSLSEAVVEQRGLQFDRRMMLVDKNGLFITQRNHPRNGFTQN